MLRTARSPLRPLWSLVYGALARAVAVGLGRGETSAAYMRAGFGDFVYGLSDLDMAIVVPDRAARRRVMERWNRACGSLPWLREIFDVAVYADSVLEDAAAASTFTYDLERPAPRAAYFGLAPIHDESSLRERPRVNGPLRDWRLLRGVDRLPALTDQSAQERRIAAWLELQTWWRYAFEACTDPTGLRKPYLCMKLVAEPARIWLWLVHRERIERRDDVLRRALDVLTEEEQAIRAALALSKELPGRPAAPLAEFLPPFVRLTARIAERLAEEVAEAGTTEVGLLGGDTMQMPLADWRAVVRPSIPEETLAPIAGDPADPGVLATTQKSVEGPYPVLQWDGVLVLPATRGLAALRAVQCRLTDPVSFALLAGSPAAAFPNVPGWSARDWGRRAVAEHGAWLADRRESAELTIREWPDPDARRAAPAVRALGRLFTAARAGLFLESVEGGHPELAVTARAAAGLVGAEAEYEEYQVARAGGAAPSKRTLAAVRARVLRLPAYARGVPELETAA